MFARVTPYAVACTFIDIAAVSVMVAAVTIPTIGTPYAVIGDAAFVAAAVCSCVAVLTPPLSEFRDE